MAETVIDVTGLSKSFGRRTVVNSVNISVRRGEIFGFLGPNGSGKTTFIRMLCGLLKPDSGSGTCLGFDILSESERIKPKVGYMAQRFSLYEDLTVRENLDFMARIFQLKEPRRSVEELIERMALGPYIGHVAGALSGGWKQRLALGACILHAPQLLLLDEPTAGVDPGARRDFWDMVHEFSAQGVTSLISTHSMDEAERCHRLAYIAYGDLLAKGSAEEITASRGLTTWRATGGDLNALARALQGQDGLDQVAAFGNALHVSGRDPKLLNRALEPYARQHHWELVDTSLEESFIDLMRSSGKENL